MNTTASVKEYYGKTLQSSADLKTDACCTPEDVPAYLRRLIDNVHPEVRARYYGCGLVAPHALEGAHILDLGSGAGQDAYVLAQLAGPAGSVTGVDMTPEQLAVARSYEQWHADRFGFANVRFIEGDIEQLEKLPLEPESFDVVVSNCVINLCTDKPAVFGSIHDFLKPGGEFYFSDIYADRRLPAALAADPVARGECLGGALYWNDFLNIARRSGFADPRLVSARSLAINDAELEQRLAPAKFFSATYRLFRIASLEPACEDYGQAVIYRGGVADADNAFILDSHHIFEKGRVFPVCGNTYRMLKETRFAPNFTFIGDWSTHYGIFPGCGVSSPFEGGAQDAVVSNGCC